MENMTDELLARIAERASDPARRYMQAAEDEARIELPIEEIDRREEAWTRRNLIRSINSGGSEMSLEDVDSAMREWRASRDAMNQQMAAQMRAWGQSPPTTKSYVETEHHFSVSSEPAGAKPLQPPPTEADWDALERIVGRSIPNDLRRLYSISDGGFGPGFTGLHSVQLIGGSCKDYRRRGPDYCGTIKYPESFLPIASEMLDYHYDLDTGRIISSNSRWEDDGLEPEDVYDIAFQSLAAMMEDWLSRS